MIIAYIALSIIILSLINDLYVSGVKVTLFSPKSILYFFLIIFYLLPIILGIEILNDLTKGINLRDRFQTISWIIILVIIASETFNRKSFKTHQIQNDNKSNYVFSAAATIAIYIVALFIISWGLINLLILGSSTVESAMHLRNGSAIIFFIIASCEFLPVLYLIFSKKPKILTLVLIITTSTILIIALGARALLVSMFFSIILFWITKNKLKLKKTMALITMLALSFFLTSANRSSNSNILNYLVRNLDQVISTSVVIDKMEKGEITYQYGGTIVDSFYFFIPSTIYPNKPKSYAPSRIVYPQMIERGLNENTKHTMNFGIVGRGYLELGLLGVVISLLIYFKLFNNLFQKILLNDFKTTKSKMFIIFTYAHILQFLILGATSHIYSILLLNFIFINGIVIGIDNLFKIRSK